MDILKARWVAIAIGAVIVVAGVTLAIVFFHGQGATGVPSAQNNIAQTSTEASDTTTTVTTVTNVDITTSPAPTTPQKSSGSRGGGSIPALPGPSITIDLMTPIANNVWTIGQPNPIAWDNPANITGEIELVNATTKAFIGVILSETGPKQTSYSWDARSIYLSRYGADQKDVVPGTYSIRIHFDGNGLGDLVSGPITIIN